MINCRCEPSLETLKAEETPKAENVFRCNICGGPVDRYDQCYKCRDCGALGDLITGIMSDCMYRKSNVCTVENC